MSEIYLQAEGKLGFNMHKLAWNEPLCLAVDMSFPEREREKRNAPFILLSVSAIVFYFVHVYFDLMDKSRYMLNLPKTAYSLL